MGKQQIFAETRTRCLAAFQAARFHIHFQGDAGQFRERRPAVRIERQRHQGRTRLDHHQIELLGDAVGKIRGADLRNRQPARGDDDAGRLDVAAIDLQHEAAISLLGNIVDLARHAPVYAASGALVLEHVDDLLGRFIAELLALVLLVVADPVFFHQREEILRRVARQRAFAEMRIFREEILRGGVNIGEITPSTTRDADFFSQLGRVIDQHHALALLGGNSRTHHAGRARADHCHIKLFCHKNSAHR